MNVFEKIEAQQKGKENTDVWMVGEQLKDICRQDPRCADIVADDLENPDMSLTAAAKKIKGKADELRKGMKGANCVCVPPNVAEAVIRDFYGLPTAVAGTVAQPPAATAPSKDSGFISLEDFL